MLGQGATIDYFDHHKMGKPIFHKHLNIGVDLSTDTCTSLIVDNQLQGRYRAWAITAAFGDNLTNKAHVLGLESGFSEKDLILLKQLGTHLNYNSYGSSLDDLFFDPKILYKKIQPFDNPFEFLEQDSEILNTLEMGFRQDMSKAKNISFIHNNEDIAVILLPNEKWAHRVGGVFGNQLANDFPERAHAVVTEKNNDNYLISIRAPLNHKKGADLLASQFPTGGGRKVAAGINELPKGQLDYFIDAMQRQFDRK